ncbi:DNA-binding PadR family transcriptional regulator [Aequitasia blattaphilus]|uniref:Helix-turn-helix domain-containing protein n=1 Tax=Aequitasia blattaphilus TaxID=2949332 RepID=A0ABT1EBX5_9FIRM|nr:helix-turn-helix domain-containing protein [Aequitasia blattaphilus]MCP1103334.1 helix-turn-helix domain-containing protein [Aequitasia blattaphilus]MCR8615974.1 helix-turn-helix domain-containing protein [Aequitasia blattaphilus]
MNQKLIDCFMNPVMCRLFMDISANAEMTARQLAESHPDIAQATLYRHLKRMVKDGVIVVVKEKPVRGTIEKTYSISDEFEKGLEDIVESNSGEAYMMLFMQYTSILIKSFQNYCKQDDIDIRKDISAFNIRPIYASNEELESAIIRIMEVVAELACNEPAENRRLRNIGLVVTPPEEKNE